MIPDNISLDFVSAILADFMNNIINGNEYAYEKAVQIFKFHGLNPEQEAMVRNSLYHLEIIANNCNDDFDLHGFVGLEANILLWTLAADWHCLNTRTLGDSDGYTHQNIN